MAPRFARSAAHLVPSPRLLEELSEAVPDIVRPILRATNESELQLCVSEVVRGLGFDTITYGATIRLREAWEPWFAVWTTMPSEWVAFYTQANLIEMDPRIQAGFGKPTPLYWDRRRLQHIKGADLFFDQAEAVGLRSGIGFYMPGTADSEHYMVSFNSCKDDSSWIGDTVAGKSYIFAAHFHQLYRQALIADRVRPPLLGYPLTAREAECLGLLAKGLTNPQIARKMAITDRTVALHVGNILTKLDAANRTEAVVLAFKLGLITP